MHACVDEVCVDEPAHGGSTFVVDDASGTTALQRVDINGRDCGPIVFQGNVTTESDGTLRPVLLPGTP